MAAASPQLPPPAIVTLALIDNCIDVTTAWGEVDKTRRALTDLRTCAFGWTPSEVGHCGTNQPAPPDVRRSETLDNGRLATFNVDFHRSKVTRAGYAALNQWIKEHLVRVPDWFASQSARLAEADLFSCSELIDFGEGVQGQVGAPTTQQVSLFNHSHSRKLRRWRALRYTEGGFFAAHTDSAMEPGHVATLILIPPKSYSDYEGGELVVHHGPDHCPSGSASFQQQTIAAHPEHFTLVALPLGTLHEVAPVTRGTRYSLTSPLLLPRELLDFMNSRAHTEPVPVAPTPFQETRAHRELVNRLQCAKAKRDQMIAACAKLEREIEVLQSSPEDTPTLRAVKRQDPMTPFVVLLSHFYRGSNDPGSLRSDGDAQTYNGLLRLYPGASIRLVNLACHFDDSQYELDDPSALPCWETLLQGYGWQEVRCEKASELSSMALSKLPVFYGCATPPGEIDSQVGVYNDETNEPYTNLSVTAAVVYGGSGSGSGSEGESGSESGSGSGSEDSEGGSEE